MEWKYQVMLITEILQNLKNIKDVESSRLDWARKDMITDSIKDYNKILRLIFYEMGGDMDALRAAIKKQNLESE